MGGSSKKTATSRYSPRVFVAPRRGRRSYFFVKPKPCDLTLRDGKTASGAIVWSRTGRGSYMPTPLVHKGILYVLGNNGLFDAYRMNTGEEIYRQRLPVIGSGFSASPIVADDKIYLANEDGEILVISAGKSCALAPFDVRVADGDAALSAGECVRSAGGSSPWRKR